MDGIGGVNIRVVGEGGARGRGSGAYVGGGVRRVWCLGVEEEKGRGR